jgi:flagellar hook-associated protein 3 FlgL
MRISFSMLTAGNLQNLNDKQAQISQLSQSIASGNKLASPSDDPYSWAQAMDVKQGLREYNSIVSGINFGTGWGQTTGSALSQLSNLVSQAKQVAISATSTTGSSQSAALATEVNGILQQAVSLANSQYGDQYVFGGTNTGSAPFSIDNSTGVVTYNGNSNPIQVKTDTSGSSTSVNLTGTDVFSFTSGGNTLNVLQEIWGLGQAIQKGDSATIQSKSATLDDAFNHVNNENAVNGATLSGLTNQQSAISVIQTNQQSTLSSLQDTDLAQAATQLQQAQTAFQAALQVTSILGSLNLASLLSTTTTA